MKKCIICGAEFEPYYALRSRQKTCGSKECMRLRNLRQNKVYYSIEENKDRQKFMQRVRRSKAVCRICGEKIERNHDIHHRASNSTMHDSCVIRDAMETIAKGEKLNSTQVQRLYQRGYTVKEIRDEVEKCKINV